MPIQFDALTSVPQKGKVSEKTPDQLAELARAYPAIPCNETHAFAGSAARIGQFLLGLYPELETDPEFGLLLTVTKYPTTEAETWKRTTLGSESGEFATTEVYASNPRDTGKAVKAAIPVVTVDASGSVKPTRLVVSNLTINDKKIVKHGVVAPDSYVAPVNAALFPKKTDS